MRIAGIPRRGPGVHPLGGWECLVRCLNLEVAGHPSSPA
jgi:hypothetical protein